MKLIIQVLRWILLIIKLIVWLVILPFCLVYYILKKLVSQSVFKAKLKRSGIPKDWANKLTRQYSPSFIDILEMSKLRKSYTKYSNKAL